MLSGSVNCQDSLGPFSWAETELTSFEQTRGQSNFQFLLVTQERSCRRHMSEMPTNRQSGFVNTAPLIAGNRSGLVHLLGYNHCEILAFEKFHDQEVSTVLATNVVQCANMRMVKLRDSASFALEALFQIGNEATEALRIFITTLHLRRVSRAR